MPTGLLFQSAFGRPWKSTTSEMVPKVGSNVAMSKELIWLLLSAHICLGIVLEYWPFVGTCTCHSYSTLYYLRHLASLFKLLPPPIPSHACPSFIYADPILMNSMTNIIKNWHKCGIIYLPD